MSIHFKGSVGTHDADYVTANVGYPSGVTWVGFSVYRLFFKRAFDIVFVLATAPIALLMISMAALLVALDGHNPFYRQKRVGRDGRHFWLLKIRTMVPQADAKLEAYLNSHPALRSEWETKQKLDNDPRITRLGAILRKSSLDELPQLWNVLTGDMSIVGPRPMMVEQQTLYPGQTYFKLRPGITGNWQVSDRNDCSFAGRAAFDDDYDRTLSFRTDMDLLVRTIGVVLRCTGR